MIRDATIIGAGPAGCVAAIILAREGWNVRLIEQHRFPRDKVCGECLSALGYDVLERLDLSDSFQQLSPVLLNRTAIHSPNGARVEIWLPQPMWGVSRLRLDQWLLDSARDSGAEILEPTRCEKLTITKTSLPVLTVRDLSTNEVSELKSSFVLLADGKRALIKPRPAATAELGIKAHFQGVQGTGDSIDLFGVDGHYGGVAPIEDGRWNVAFSVPRGRVQAHEGDLDALFNAIVKENLGLKDHFDGAKRCTPWLASALARFAPSRSWQATVIPIGNAAASIEPIGGEGMGLAMRSAELAARMLRSDHFDARALRREYARLWRTRSLSCRAAAMIVSNRRIANAIAPTLARVPIVRKAAMSLIGKRATAKIIVATDESP